MFVIALKLLSVQGEFTIVKFYSLKALDWWSHVIAFNVIVNWHEVSYDIYMLTLISLNFMMCVWYLSFKGWIHHDFSMQTVKAGA